MNVRVVKVECTFQRKYLVRDINILLHVIFARPNPDISENLFFPYITQNSLLDLKSPKEMSIIQNNDCVNLSICAYLCVVGVALTGRAAVVIGLGYV